jgi:hypothetical protein
MDDQLAYGQALFRRIFNADRPNNFGGQSMLDGYKAVVRLYGSGYELELYVDPGKDALHKIHWETLTDEDEIVLSTREDRPLYRRVANDQPYVRPPTVDRLNLVVVFSNPRNLEKISRLRLMKAEDFQDRLDRLKQVLDPLQAEGWISYQLLYSGGDFRPTLTNIQQALEGKLAPSQNGRGQSREAHIIHFIAHGYFDDQELEEGQDPAEGAFKLFLEAPNGNAYKATIAEMGNLLQDSGDLRLAVLASCNSATSPGGDAIAGLGPQLAFRYDIPAVIAMQQLVSVDAAELIAETLYRDLFRTGSIQAAMAATRKRLFARDREFYVMQRQYEWAIPILYLSNSDGRLFRFGDNLADKIGDLEPLPWRRSEEPPEDEFADPALRAGMREARQYGLDGEAYRRIFVQQAPTLVEAGLAGRREQFARRQQLTDLDQLKPVDIDPGELQEYVYNKKGLVLPPSTFNQIADALSSGKHIIMIGPHGTGKTSLAQAVCQYARENGFTRGDVLTTATAEWTGFDTIGGYMPTRDGPLAFKPGIFLEAVREGNWLVIDEINRAEIDKAFGELFTLLSGQSVQLPYQIGNEFVAIEPPEEMGDLDENDYLNGRWYRPEHLDLDHVYVLHPNWRIIGTMNVFDRSLLFAMSFAFMRRFAFVDVGLPDPDTYHDLCLRWIAKELRIRPGEGDLGGRPAFWQDNNGLKDWQPAALAIAMLRAHQELGETHVPRATAARWLGEEPPNGEIAAEDWTAFLDALAGQFATEEDSQAYCDALGAATALTCLVRFANLLARDSILMRRRAIGPAIVKDMIRFMARRLRRGGSVIQDDSGRPGRDLVALREAFLLYVVPQLDGLDKLTIHQIYADIAYLLWEEGLPQKGEPADVLARIRLLYLHVPDVEWPGRGERTLLEDVMRLRGEAASGDGD